MILILIIFLSIIFLLPKEKNSAKQPNTKSNLFNPFVSAKSETSLKLAIENILKDAKGRYGILVKNLKTEEAYTLNEHQSFKSGSLYKLWVMGTVLDKIEAGTLRNEDILSGSIEALNKKFGIDPELAELKKGPISLSVQNALLQMITISHNYAALLLTEKVRLSSVAEYLKTKGFRESGVGINGDDPVTTPADIALFYEKLYKGQLSGKENTDKMLELLKKQQNKKKLGRDLPKEVVIAHKTGELGWFSHDAGIVYTPKGDYIIVVFSESDYPGRAEDKIAQISKVVYEYFK